jgi:chromate reductase, NAD(P)H dehydrogenase (quinone)
MKRILAISGSAASKSSNFSLMQVLSKSFASQYEFVLYQELRDLPLFRPEAMEVELPEKVQYFKRLLAEADGVVISTPEYTHNIPAVLKNGLEWITASGELNGKKVLPITFTPKEPRGQWAMQSLIFSLKTMNAQILPTLSLYKDEFEWRENQPILTSAHNEMISQVLELF